MQPAKFLWVTCLIILNFSCSSVSEKSLSFDKELSGYEYPYKVSGFEFKSQEQNLVMRYGDLGNKESGKIAVLLHGKNFSGYYWDQVAGDLVKKGYRVIIPDQIGFGKSSKPKSYQYSFYQLAHNTFRLLEELNIKKITLVGHSMGGMLAVHMATMSDVVAKLVLVNPIGLEDYLKYAEFKDPEFFYENEVGKSVENFRNYQRKNYYAGVWDDKYEKLLTPFKGQKNGADWKVVAWNNALTYGPIFNEEIVSKFPNLKVDTYLILGTRDRTGPGRGWKKPGVKRELGRYDKLGLEIKKLNPKKVNLIELEGLGHMPQFENYQIFSKVFYEIF